MPIPLESEQEQRNRAENFPYNLLAEPAHTAETLERCYAAIAILSEKLGMSRNAIFGLAEVRLTGEKGAAYRADSAKEAARRALLIQNQIWIRELADEALRGLVLIPDNGGPRSWNDWKCGSCGRRYDGAAFIRGRFLGMNLALASKKELLDYIVRDLIQPNITYAANCQCDTQSPYFRLIRGESK